MTTKTGAQPLEHRSQPDSLAYRISQVRRRLVVVGLGSIGRRHVRLLAARPDLDVAGCESALDVMAKARVELGETAMYPDFESALESHPDIVVIATPHDLHAQQAIAAMQAGADVLCEKPLCLDGTEAGQMIACARKTGRQLGVGFQLHFHPGILRVRALIEQGIIGEVAHVHARVGSFITLRNSVSRYQQSQKGALLLDYSHQPDLILWLLGRLPTAVTLSGVEASGLPLSSSPNVMSLVLEFGRSLLATIHLNYVQIPQRHEWELVGTKGWMILDADRGTLRIGLRETESELVETISVNRDDTYRAEHQAFIDGIDGKCGMESSAEAAARSVELFAMAMRSWQENCRVACTWRDY